MPVSNKIDCKYCGSVIELSRAVVLNPETEEYEYACVNCALAWEKKGSDPPFNP